MFAKLFCFAVLAATTAANPMFPDTGINAGVDAAMSCFEMAFHAAAYSWHGKYFLPVTWSLE